MSQVSPQPSPEPIRGLTGEEPHTKRHVVYRSHGRRRMRKPPALRPAVAFERHLPQDRSGYPEKVGSPRLNLCTITWDRADRGERCCAAVEAADPESVDIDPLEYL